MIDNTDDSNRITERVEPASEVQKTESIVATNQLKLVDATLVS